MTDPIPTVVDLLASGSVSQPQSVSERIEHRLSVLQTWLADGIPMGKTIPASLNAARIWEDLDIGMQPIGSPNDFTTTHAEHGRSIKQIGQLLTDLRRRFGRPKGPTPKPSSSPKFDHAAYDRALTQAVSQWHNERNQHLSEQRRANDANTRSAALLDENAEKDRLIADLRSQLTARSGLRAVE